MPGSDAVRIQRMSVRGLASRANLPRLLGQIEAVAWPETQELVLVQSLTVESPLGELATSLSRRLREMLRTVEQVSCGRPASDGAKAVRFVDEVERVAALSVELAVGTARTRWYFQAESALFGDRPGAALARLWARRPLELPSVGARLIQAGKLERVWGCLKEEDCRLVLAALVGAAELPPALVRLGRTEAREHASKELALPALPGLRDWRGVVQRDALNEASAELAAVVLLLEAAPLALRSERGADLVRAVSRAIASQGGPVSPKGPASGRFLLEGASEQFSPGSEGRDEPPRAGDQAVSGSDGRAAVSDGKAARGAGPLRDMAREGGSEALATFPERGVVSLETSYGGVLYLVNAFNHPRLRGLIEELGVFALRPHGWAFWRAIALDLGLPEDEPIARWLGQVLERLPDPVPPVQASERAAFHAAARDVYGLERWNEALLEVRGVLRATESHLDLYLDVNAARIELRLAGLDLNPGWVPWLGRVVSIHFIETRAG